MTTTDVTLYELDEPSGKWVKPLAPSSVASGVATFAVPSFSMHALAVPTLVVPTVALSHFVSRVHGKVLAQRAGEGQRVVRTGDFVRVDATITTERGAYPTLRTANAALVRVQPSTKVNLGPEPNAFTLPEAGALYLNVPKAQTGNSSLCYRVTTPDAAVAVRCDRDAIFSVKRVACPLGTVWTDLLLEQGAVELTAGDETLKLDSRERRVGRQESWR